MRAHHSRRHTPRWSDGPDLGAHRPTASPPLAHVSVRLAAAKAAVGSLLLTEHYSHGAFSRVHYWPCGTLDWGDAIQGDSYAARRDCLGERCA